MRELHRHLGADADVPPGEIGVSPREVGCMTGMVKKITNRAECVFTGKRPDDSVSHVDGANVAGFMLVADAMLAQGVVWSSAVPRRQDRAGQPLLALAAAKGEHRKRLAPDIPCRPCCPACLVRTRIRFAPYRPVPRFSVFVFAAMGVSAASTVVMTMYQWPYRGSSRQAASSLFPKTVSRRCASLPHEQVCAS